MKSTVNSTLSRQDQIPHENDLALKKKEETKFLFFSVSGSVAITRVLAEKNYLIINIL